MYARRTYQAPPWPAEKESQSVREDLGVHTVLTINKDLNKKKKESEEKGSYSATTSFRANGEDEGDEV